jgi:F0F1-type ATP synthase membrane subunit c/vacuolar-type H+-ATPase subunit K
VVAAPGTSASFSARAVGNLRQNPGMESSLKLLRIVQLVLLAAIVFYAVIAEWAHPASGTTTKAFFYVMTGLALWAVEGIFFFRRRKVKPSEEVLSVRPEDLPALKAWHTAYIVIYALCESVALYGVVLRFLRFSFPQVVAFYVAGFLLLLYFAPRRPTNAIG